MCMAMGGTPQQVAAPVTPAPPPENTIAFDNKFTAQMKSGEGDITVDNPLLAKRQRASLKARNESYAAAEAPQAGLQNA